jgi:hypothetical protein
VATKDGRQGQGTSKVSQNVDETHDKGDDLVVALTNKDMANKSSTPKPYDQTIDGISDKRKDKEVANKDDEFSRPREHSRGGSSKANKSQQVDRTHNSSSHGKT